ncbi:MAG: hypothetical protein P1U69_03225 [Parvibaculaceae bacterium]|nr:hypothetical protein [Parvibaculaceae bacterium]
MDKFAKAALPVVAGVVIAGLLMNYGRDLPLIGDAHAGFDS